MREINLTEIPQVDIPMHAQTETANQPTPVIVDAAAVCLIAPSDWKQATTRLGLSGIGYIYVSEPPEQVWKMVAQATVQA